MVGVGETRMTVRRILIVDDEEHIREVAQATLELVGGWEVLTADSGLEALVAAAAARPDAILLDVMMPGMDGLTALRHMRADAAVSAIPVVLLTAKVQAADRAHFAGLGVAGTIAKPFDPMTLPAQVAEVLGWR